MRTFHVAVVPVGKIEREELEHALSRVAKVIRAPVELKESLPVPQGVEDTTRRQFRASETMNRLRTRLPQLGAGKLIGAEGEAGDRPPPQSDGVVFVTDVDLFTANTDGVFSALKSVQGVAVVSVRRLREAFYRRKADPTKHRSRLVKEILRMVARLRGHKECADPKCAIAPSKMLVDLDIKEENYCRACSEFFFQGSIHL